jgi:hypothetical protein
VNFFFIFLFIPFLCFADINVETHDISVEYGLGYHTLTGVQKSNNSEGRLVSLQNPYWLAGYTIRTGRNLPFEYLVECIWCGLKNQLSEH